MHRILLKEGSGVVEALKAIRGPLFGMFLVAIDLRQARVCDAGDRCPVSILLSRSEEYCERQVWGTLTRSRSLGGMAGIRSVSRPPPERAGTERMRRQRSFRSSRPNRKDSTPCSDLHRISAPLNPLAMPKTAEP